MAHRAMYAEHMGPIPDGLVLDHLCRVKSCVNPTHLEPVTPLVNFQRGMGYWALGTCRRGLHDITDPANVRIENGHRSCVPCWRDRYREAGKRWYASRGKAMRAHRRSEARTGS
jgi:hypothetical protein